MMIFVGLLALGLAYAWRNGHLDWIKSKQEITDFKSPGPKELYKKINERYPVNNDQQKISIPVANRKIHRHLPTKNRSAIKWPDHYQNRQPFQLVAISSLFPMTFGIACCAIEFMSTGTAPYDMDRLGMVPRPTPRQSDVILLPAPLLLKWPIAFVVSMNKWRSLAT